MKKKIENVFVQGFKSILAVLLISMFSVTLTKAQNNKGEGIVSSQTVTATVTKINHKSREVTIKTADGQVAKFVASTDVQNLDQVKKGDLITVVYTEAFTYEVKKHSTTTAGTTTAGAVAKPGEKPAGAVAQQTTVTVKITAVNTKTPSVTIKGSDGEEQTIKVKDPSKLSGIKVGDMVDITYTEAFAIKVDKAAKK
jgi:Cu/Ag efflux protein CusF